MITNVQSNDYLADDGSYVSEVTFYENEIFSSLIKVVNQDGSYTVTADQGDYHEVYEGVIEDYESSSQEPPLAVPSNPRALAWTYSYWGQDVYDISINEFQYYSTVLQAAAKIASLAGLGTASLALNAGRFILLAMVSYYSQYGTDMVYFNSYRYLGIENVSGINMYHHKSSCYIYSNASHTNLIAHEIDEFASTNFCWN